MHDFFISNPSFHFKPRVCLSGEKLLSRLLKDSSPEKNYKGEVYYYVKQLSTLNTQSYWSVTIFLQFMAVFLNFKAIFMKFLKELNNFLLLHCTSGLRHDSTVM